MPQADEYTGQAYSQGWQRTQEDLTQIASAYVDGAKEALTSVGIPARDPDTSAPVFYSGDFVLNASQRPPDIAGATRGLLQAIAAIQICGALALVAILFLSAGSNSRCQNTSPTPADCVITPKKPIAGGGVKKIGSEL